jgi:hypothetical protein
MKRLSVVWHTTKRSVKLCHKTVAKDFTTVSEAESKALRLNILRNIRNGTVF